MHARLIVRRCDHFHAIKDYKTLRMGQKSSSIGAEMVTLEFQASFAELTGRAPCAAQEQTKRQPLLFRTVFNAAEEPEVIHEETYVMFRENVEALHHVGTDDEEALIRRRHALVHRREAVPKARDRPLESDKRHVREEHKQDLGDHELADPGKHLAREIAPGEEEQQ